MLQHSSQSLNNVLFVAAVAVAVCWCLHCWTKFSVSLLLEMSNGLFHSVHQHNKEQRIPCVRKNSSQFIRLCKIQHVCYQSSLHTKFCTCAASVRMCTKKVFVIKGPMNSNFVFEYSFSYKRTRSNNKALWGSNVPSKLSKIRDKLIVVKVKVEQDSRDQLHCHSNQNLTIYIFRKQ